MKFNIAVVQFRTRQWQPQENLRRADQFAAKAKRAGADIVVFPEDFLTGPCRLRPDLADAKAAHRKHFQALAKKVGIDIVPGTIIERVGRRFYNAAYYIDSAGRVLARYCKVNLWVTEKQYVSRGRGYPVFRTRWGKAGLAICWDLAFPEPFRAMARRGAEIVFCPSCWSYQDAGVGIKAAPDSEITFVNACATARAFENEMIVAFSNMAGHWRGSDGSECDSMGRSQVAVPFHGPLRVLRHNREGMFVQQVDTAILKDAESAYEIRSDIRSRKL